MPSIKLRISQSNNKVKKTFLKISDYIKKISDYIKKIPSLTTQDLLCNLYFGA